MVLSWVQSTQSATVIESDAADHKKFWCADGSNSHVFANLLHNSAVFL